MKDTSHQVKEGILSIILLSYQSEANIESAVEAIITGLNHENIPFEIVVIDDGSLDHSVHKARTLASKHPQIRVYPLDANYSSPMAQFAGLEKCTGDCACPMPDDGQRPLSNVIEMYRSWQRGNIINIAYREERNDGILSDTMSSIYYRMMNQFSKIKFPPGGSDGYLIDRELIDYLVHYSSMKNSSPVIELLKLRRPMIFIGYERPPSTSISRWTFNKKTNLALNTFFASSIFPLRMITWIGFITFIFSLLAIGIIILAKIFTDNTLFGLPIRGWATLMVMIAMFNGMVMLSLGIISEYLWRMYDEVRRKPAYNFKKTIDKNETRA